MANWRNNEIIRNAEDEVQYVHFRTSMNGPTKLTATLAVLPFGDKFCGAFAFVNPSDNPSYAIGREISRGRAAKYIASCLSPSEVKAPRGAIICTWDSSEQLAHFVNLAKSYPNVRDFIAEAMATGIELPEQG